MASPSTVISLGYGSWGSVNDVITLGYGIGTEAGVAASVKHNFQTDTLESYRSAGVSAYTTADHTEVQN